VVRPVARYRPAARRSGGLVPIFFVQPSLLPLDQAMITIWSGSEGELETIDIFNTVPQELAPTASAGLLDLLVQTIETEFEDDPFVIFTQSESIAESRNFFIASQHVINDTAYVIALRSHRVTHTASVTYRLLGLSGEFISPLLSITRSAVLNAVYDVAVFEVDVRSKASSGSTQPLYQYEAKPVEFGNFYQLQYETSSYQVSSAVAVSNALPGTHPFKPCSPSIWSTTPVSTDPIISNSNNTPPLSLTSFSAQITRNLAGLLGLNTNTQQRIIGQSLFVGQQNQVLELADYRQAASSCSLFQDSALPWADSFIGYSPSSLRERQEIFVNLDGLSIADQQAFLSTSYVAPEGLAPGQSTAGSTVSAEYFLGTDATSSLEIVNGNRVDLRYWIES